MRPVSKAHHVETIRDGANNLLAKLYLFCGIQGHAPAEGVRKIDAGLSSQIIGEIYNVGCPVDGGVINKLIRDSHHILIKRHHRDHIHGEEQHEGHQHYGDRNVYVSFPIFSFQHFSHVMSPPNEEIST